jgi:hypothetical protein
MWDENQAVPVPDVVLQRPNPRVALAVWLLLLLIPGIGGLLLHLQELAGLVALAGLFIAAQAADMDPQWFVLNSVLSLIVPVGGSLSFAALAVFVWQGDSPEAARAVATLFCAAASLFALASAWPNVARWLVRVLFRGSDDSSTLRLAARLVSLTLLISLPAALAFSRMMDSLLGSPELLTGARVLAGELLGYLVLTLAGVGFLVRRDLPQSAERLGLRRLRARDLGFIVAGAAALLALNTGTEWLQRTSFPALWAHDHEVNDALVKGLSAGQAVLLGVTAGVGEELTMRGALQPRLGLILTSVLFAGLHVQYSWFGMLVVMLIGVLLGVLRKRTSTTVCIAVHALYDVAAIFST